MKRISVAESLTNGSLYWQALDDVGGTEPRLLSVEAPAGKENMINLKKKKKKKEELALTPSAQDPRTTENSTLPEWTSTSTCGI